MVYRDGLFYFDLTDEEQTRIDEYKVLHNNIYIALGGIIIPAQGVIPLQPRYEIKNRGWLNRDTLGKKRTTHSEKRNKDGSIVTTDEEAYISDDGTRVRKITETTYESNSEYNLIFNTNPYGSLYELFSALPTPLKRGTHTISTSEVSPKQYPRQIVRTTKTLPPTSQVETVVQEVEIIDPTDLKGPSHYGNKSSKTRRQVYTEDPKVFGKPVTITAVTGKVWHQRIVSTQVAEDKAFWNDEMSSTAFPQAPNATDLVLKDGSRSLSNTEVTIDPVRNLRITHTFNESFDADGNKSVESQVTEEPYLDPIAQMEKAQEEARQETINTIESPLRETSVNNTYDKNGSLLRTTTSTTERTPNRQETQTEEKNSDGTTTTRVSIQETDSAGTVLVTETENTTRDLTQVTTTRSDSINYDEGIKTITLTRQTTNTDGSTRTEEKNYRYAIAQAASTIETVKETFDDDIFQSIVSGIFSLEFDFSGTFMENSFIQKFATKNIEHQQAWAMAALLEQQLELGDRLGQTVKKTLYEDYLRIFSGNQGTAVRGGPVLDRIALEVFGQTFVLGCVFSPQSGFRPEYIAGSERIYSWSLNVQTVSQLVNNSESPDNNWLNIEAKNIPVLPGDYTKRTF